MNPADPLPIRTAGAEDRAWCADLMVRSEPWITLKRTRPEAVKILNSAAKECYVAVEDDTRLGFVLLDMGGGLPGYIQSVCVEPELRGRRIGTRLILFAEDRILRDAHNVFMCVSSFNTDAQRLYSRLGYARVGELHDYLVEGASEILLRKTRGPIAAR
jgi:ribosomal-protein-alanine N-acetyltransferase